MEKRVKTLGKPLLPTILANKALIILIIMIIISQAVTGGLFLSGSNISNLLKQTAVSTIIAAGFTVILASGQIDLSVGNMLSLVGVCYAYFSLSFPLPVAIILALLVGAFTGFLNGYISTTLKLNAFVFTLATSQVFKGAAHLICSGKGVNGLSDHVKLIGQKMLFGVIPLPMVIMLMTIILIYILINKTRLGRRIIAVGGNSQAARVSGINVKWTAISSFVITGFCVAVAAIVLTGRTAVALPGAGEGTEMDAVAAVVIGGTPLSGGKANVIGTLVGVLIMGTINNVLNLTDVSNFWQWVAKGLIIAGALALDVITEAVSNRRREAA